MGFHPSLDLMKSETKYKVILPVAILKKNTKFYLNLNQYRNWHYQANNQLKRIFKDQISSQLDFKIKGKVHILYFYFAPDKRKRDLMNIISVVDKYFQDALVERNCIEADDTSVVTEIHGVYSGIDKENPRVEAILISI
jgi:predicted lactoylglutathione lyase